MTSTSEPASVHGRLVRPDDGPHLAQLFAGIRDEGFHPHPLTDAAAARVAAYGGRDVYAVLEASDSRFVAYGMLRGWDDGFALPSLGLAVHEDCRRRGYGRLMMEWLHAEARRRGASQVRLRVAGTNGPARALYAQLGYARAGEERGEIVMVLQLGGRPRPGPSDHQA
jgi:ribosomal-protein-alanine N-acetyltransferase